MANRNEKKNGNAEACGNCRSPWKSAAVAFGISIDDFHRCLEKATQQTLRLFHSYHRPAVINYLGTLKSRNPKTRLPDPAAKE